MTRVAWDTFDYDVGLHSGMFYPKNSPGEVWNGLISVDEVADVLGERTMYLDGMKVSQGRKEAPYSAKVATYTNPASWYEVLTYNRYNGFSMSYRTQNQIHLVYNCTAAPSDTTYSYQDPGLYQWLITTTPVELPEGGFASHLVIDGTVSYPENITDLEDILYGTDTTDPRMPTPLEVLEVFEENSILRVINNGDGSFTIIGPDSALTFPDANTFQVTWPSIVFKNIFEEEYTISSL